MKHLNGTLGWIPSDKPVCVQEGKAPPVCVSNRDVGLCVTKGAHTRGCSPCFWLKLHAGGKASMCHEGWDLGGINLHIKSDTLPSLS